MTTSPKFINERLAVSFMLIIFQLCFSSISTEVSLLQFQRTQFRNRSGQLALSHLDFRDSYMTIFSLIYFDDSS